MKGTDQKREQINSDQLTYDATVNAALAELSSALISPKSIEDISWIVLEQAKQLTQSPYGYVAYIDPETGYLVAPTLTRDVWDSCEMPHKETIFKKFTGLWGWGLKTKKPLLTNAPTKDPRFSRLPEGHIPIDRFLSVPALMGETLVSQISLANSDRDYAEHELELAERLAALYAVAVQRSWDEQLIREAHALLKRSTDELANTNRHLMQEIEERKQAEKALRESENQLRLLSSHLLTAQDTERGRISRELHDELGQDLAVLKLQLKSVEKKLRKDQVILKEACVNTVQHVEQVIENVRRISRDLRPVILEDVGLTAALRALIEDFARHSQIETSVEVGYVDHLLSREAQVSVFTIFQEALTNIGKRAEASRVSVVIQEQDSSLHFILEDSGKGFDPQKVKLSVSTEKGLGLATMDERVRLLGGSLQIQSQPAMGTKISFTIPID